MHLLPLKSATYYLRYLIFCESTVLILTFVWLTMERIGKLREVQKGKFEWEIEGFLELPHEVDTRYYSPIFTFCGTSWEISIYPNGDEDVETAGWIDLCIFPVSFLTAPVTLDLSFHFKTVEGKADALTGYTETNNTFDDANGEWGRSKFLSRSELIERQSDLLPLGILTVICTMKKYGTIGTAGFLKLQEQFKEISENGKFSDVVLKVDEKEFKSHRCVLGARSPVFSAMLSHDMKEKNTGVVDIEDVDPSAFSDFLSYLYTANEEIITSENVVKLFGAADKYQVDELRRSCLGYMLMNISVDNFCDVLSLSLVHEEKDLRDVCTRFFIENSLAIVKTPKWLMFMKDNLVVSNELYIKHLEDCTKKKVPYFMPMQFDFP